MTDKNEFLDALAANATAVGDVLDRLLAANDGHERKLMAAMRYASLAGGKRVRPFLVTQTARLFEVAPDRALRAAAAVEMIHCYSLVHDDLPAMDDDALRRGQPTCHIAYDEATAILAGDALLTLAFEVLAEDVTHPDGGVRANLVLALAKAAGHEGMVGGQVLDIYAEEHDLDLDQVTRLQRMKTGELIAVSCAMGAILGHASVDQRLALDRYAAAIGLAFQIADDLLDVEGDEAEVGKKVGKDQDAGKATFVSLLGVEPARTKARELEKQAQEHLAIFGEKADSLRSLANFIVHRRS